jgi:hypothetical protein
VNWFCWEAPWGRGADSLSIGLRGSGLAAGWPLLPLGGGGLCGAFLGGGGSPVGCIAAALRGMICDGQVVLGAACFWVSFVGCGLCPETSIARAGKGRPPRAVWETTISPNDEGCAASHGWGWFWCWGGGSRPDQSNGYRVLWETMLDFMNVFTSASMQDTTWFGCSSIVLLTRASISRKNFVRAALVGPYQR